MKHPDNCDCRQCVLTEEEHRQIQIERNRQLREADSSEY